MRLNDIENWGLNIIERVESKQPIEDLRVELKSKWPKDISKTARQLAGHANAAHGESILWLIGIDEKSGVTGANYEEISNWKQSVESKFDGLSPTLTHINIPYKGKTVVALFFETERRPFLVKNPEGGAISLEVPWRDAGSTRTANRTDLLKMLSPIYQTPLFEVIQGQLVISEEKQNGYGGIICRGGLSIDVYITPQNNNRIIIPCHQCRAKLKFVDSGLILDIEELFFSYSGTSFWVGDRTSVSSTIICTPTEIVIDGPGMAKIQTANPSLTEQQKSLAHGNVEIELKMRTAGGEQPISVTSNFKQVEKPEGALGAWILS